ncbi:HAD family hydrolase [Egicoccus sp. AB-alg2]|uniref:HAD family hydrolase n=1 Tax=Egicoccus sp. AB-alg2 TaxID=3242693 RepID=UPI00359E6735
MSTPHPTAGILLDLDGTLVDSVYQHVVAWHEAFHEAGYAVPQWRIHAGIGMGSDRIVPWLLGRHVDDADALADAHTQRFLDRADTLERTAGALELLDDLDRREVPYIIATSASTEEREALLEVLGRKDLPYTDADDVATSKPAPDLLLTSCTQAGIDPAQAIMVGDAPWDALSAQRAGMRAIAVRCGGFGDAELTGAGAQRIVDAPRELVGQL